MPSRLQVVALLIALPVASVGVRAQAVASSGTPAARRAGTLSGTVYDSVAGKPLARAVVQMRAEAASAIYTTTTDAGGRYMLRNVVPGSYLATFFHPALDALGLEPLLYRVQVDSGPPVRRDFAIPSPATVWALTCQPADAADSTGLLLGHVTEAESEAPVAGAQVTARWTELLLDRQRGLRTAPREVTARTDSAGLYAICGVPSDGSVAIEVQHGTAASGMVSVTVPARGLRQAALTVSDANTRVVLQTDSAGLDSGTVLVRGTARLAGTVRSQTGAPMGDVELRVLGTGVEGKTASDGTFLLTGLPAGTYTLATRRLGLAPEQQPVSLVSGRTTRVVMTVREAVVLSTTTIYGKAHANRAMERLAGFLHRKRAGWGHFLTRADIQRRQPFNTTDLFQTMLGVRVRHSTINPFVNSVSMRNGFGFACQPNVYLDDVPIIRNLNIGAGGVPMPGGGIVGTAAIDDWVNPDDIAAIEVYPTITEAPAQFRGVSCGSIVIWTIYAFPSTNTEQ